MIYEWNGFHYSNMDRGYQIFNANFINCVAQQPGNVSYFIVILARISLLIVSINWNSLDKCDWVLGKGPRIWFLFITAIFMHKNRFQPNGPPISFRTHTLSRIAPH